MTTACTPEELAWFSLHNYDGFRTASTQVWAQVIWDRLSLEQFRQRPENHAFVLEKFSLLQSDPVQSLGFSMRVNHRNPDIDTSTVRLLSVDHAHILSEEFGEIEIGSDLGTIAVDRLLRDRATPISDFVHLSLDLRGTDEKILDDFAKILKTVREATNDDTPNGDFANKVYGWHRAKIVPYFDLMFYAALHDREIKRSTLADLLQLGSISEGTGKDALKYLKPRTSEVISHKYFHILRTLSDVAKGAAKSK